MPAQFIPIGEAAHDQERQALRFLVDGLPSRYTVYGNAWLVERSGVVYELDAVVVAPHAIFVVEIKSYRGRIEGTDHDWYVPHPIPSPIKKNRVCAQVLKSLLKRESFRAGQVWVQGLVFLSATTDCGVRGSASNDRVHTRKTMLAALQDEALVKRLSGWNELISTDAAQKDLTRLLTGAQKGPRPTRHIREYEIVSALSHHDTFTELVGRNNLSGVQRLLRIYGIPPLATEEQRQRITERARWEAQVLGRLGRCEGILSADPPFADEAGIVLPLEYFEGITLPTWIEKYGPETRHKEKADLKVRTDLWLRIAATLDEAHRQGVVHRLLRPEVILVEDRVDPGAIRVTEFDLAKQLTHDSTVMLTSLADERLIFAAPEVVTAFSSAEPASDQFGLGVILAWLLTGRSLFENTRQLMAQRRLVMRVRDLAQRLPLTLDEAVCRMVQLRATDRFPTLAEAIDAVRSGRDPSAQGQLALPAITQAPLDADNLEPGTRVGADYEIVTRLGQGGMSVVYAARHLVSGHTRALKIARTEDAAENALRDEYLQLAKLDHPNLVHVIDISKMVEGRLTLVMDRVGGETLRQWQAKNPQADPQTRRRLAEDLLAGLDYLEQKGITHKDLKPDNLLVSDGRLILIDFSLVSVPEDAPYGGTALYRDPSCARWSHGTDRYAAALCLFELYAGRHAFDGRVPEPGESPSVHEDDIEPPGLAEFFRKALHPIPERRFTSAKSMRDALLVALGDTIEPVSPILPEERLDATTPLQATSLSRRAVNALARSQVATVGELLAMSQNQIRTIHAIGTKTAGDIIAFQQALVARGIQATAGVAPRPEPAIVPELASSPEPVTHLNLAPAVLAALDEARLKTVGAVAGLSHARLLEIPGIGRRRLVEVVEALHQFDARNTADEGPHTLDRIWERAAGALNERQRVAVERVVGLLDEPESQVDLARELQSSQSQISVDCSKGLERLDSAALDEVQSAMEAIISGFGGIARAQDVGLRLEEHWPAGLVSGVGFVRLLVRRSAARAHLLEVDGADGPVLARTTFDRDTLRSFAAEVIRLASQWPPVEPDTARRTLSVLLPHYEGDPLSLGVRLCTDVALMDSGHLFIGPVDPRQSLGFVLDQIREPISLNELERRVRQTFGENTPYPTADHLLELLRELDCRVEGDRIIPGTTGSLVAPPALLPDALPGVSLRDRSPEEVVRDKLREAADSRGFRMLVTPPERHAEIGRSVAAALGGTWISFDEAFFIEHGARMPALERAERFISQRGALTEAATDTLFRLLEAHGRPGHTVVLGDTALFGTCDALDLPRRLYDETLSGSRGFWVVVVPGVIHNRQPRFNEDAPIWHLEGATLPLMNPLPPPSPGSGRTP